MLAGDITTCAAISAKVPGGIVFSSVCLIVGASFCSFVSAITLEKFDDVIVKLLWEQDMVNSSGVCQNPATHWQIQGVA